MGKKKIVGFAGFVIISLGIFILAINMPVRCFKIKTEDVPVTISVYSKESALEKFFEPAVMGRSYDYNLVVREKGIFAQTLLRRDFRFNNDGATIDESNITVELENNDVIVKIRSSEMKEKTFKIELD